MADDGATNESMLIPSPSEFMRRRRPEQFSDSAEQTLYHLSRDVLEQRLETLTARNDMQAFERFARALCERFICPFLKPATGPEGGGDGKVDTETIKVSEEIVERRFEGRADRGDERWGFAFSAKKDWKPKARSDVTGMVGTGRGYTTAFFVTSQYARSKDRSEMQDALAAKHGIMVEILDRNWIVEQVIEKDARDIAYVHLGIGDLIEEAKLGPLDRERRDDLVTLDREIETPGLADETPLALVRYSLKAAIFSRELERPRYETDGRFERAIRLADRYGTDRHSLKARYEKLWTALNWFDDVQAVRDGYDDIEKRAFAMDHASSTEKAMNLLLVLSGPFAQITAAGSTFSVPAAWERIETHLETMKNDTSRPNNSLTARTALVIRGITAALAAGDQASVEDRLSEIITIVDAARGLMEYDFEKLEELVESLGDILGGNTVLSRTVDHLGDALQQRMGETARGLLYLRRCRQLDIENDRFEIIRRLGTVIDCLTKEEHLTELGEAAYILAIVYRGAGLPWAARAATLFALSTIVIRAEQSTVPPSTILPTFLLLGWIDLELGLVAELLEVIVIVRGALVSLPFDDASQDLARQSLDTFDMSLGGQFLNGRNEDLSAFESFPDILMSIDLPAASTGLLYALGHEDEAFGTVADDREDNRNMLARLAAEPTSALPSHGLFGDEEGSFVFNADILGLRLSISGNCGHRGALLAQVLISLAETLLATAFEAGFAAHREACEVRVEMSDALTAPVPHMDEVSSVGVFQWPTDWDPANPKSISAAQDALIAMVISVIFQTCMFKDGKASFQTLMGTDTATSRITATLGMSVSISRVFNGAGATLTSFLDHYSEMPPRHFASMNVLPLATISPSEATEVDANVDNYLFGEVRSHRNLKTRSLIDVPLWNIARWRGVAVMYLPPLVAPILALMYEDATVGSRIFEGWRKRFGNEDTSGELSVIVVTDLDGRPSSHYAIILTTNLDGELSSGDLMFVVARAQIMEPETNKNLQLFLSEWNKVGAFYLGATSMPERDRPPELQKGSLLLKRHLRVVQYVDLEDHEVGILKQAEATDPVN